MIRVLAAALIAFLMATAALAQSASAKSPFGVGTAPQAATADQAATGTLQSPGGFSGWLMARQQEVQRELAGAVRGLKSANPTAAAATLALISFLYGVLHAAGPGHGKAVISSYVLANRQTLHRGVALSFMAAFIQACSAIALFGIVVLVVKATSVERKHAEWILEIVSWGLVTAIGAWMLYRLLAPAAAGGAAGHDHHGHGHAHGDCCGHAHAPDHVHDASCGHVHMPGPEQLQGPWSWSRALSLAFSVGIRPCTGAIGVLSVASLQGLLWAGIVSTFVMAFGTALTVSALAAMAVGSRQAALTWGGGSGVMAERVELAASLLGATLVILLGGYGFLSSLAGPAPF